MLKTVFPLRAGGLFRVGGLFWAGGLLWNAGLACMAFTMSPAVLQAQTLGLKEAVQKGWQNYGTIRAKSNYVKASRANLQETHMEYLPDLTLSAQHDYGTINSMNGPLYGLKGGSVGSSGPIFGTQNWRSAFGALYLTNVSWDFFTFGRYREKSKVAESVLSRDQRDLDQERFQQGVRVSAAYLNLLAAQQLSLSQQKNLDRAQALQVVVVARVKNGLNPGVDSSQADAEVSNARIAWTNAIEFQQEQANQLSQLMGVAAAADFQLDTLFLARIPTAMDLPPAQQLDSHPLLRFYRERIHVSDEETKFLRTNNYPVFSLFGVLQDRGSGFKFNYGPAFPDAYSTNYFDGVSPSRANYLLGVGFTWNLTNPLRVHQQVTAQQYISQGLQEEYGLINEQLKAQLALAETRIKNALSNYREAPIQVKAASDAYLQKSVLYKNGLATIVDVTTALFALNRAETDRDIAYNNVWQALLFKAASSGDFGLFFNEF
jgi:outer membrane protein TolC